MAVREKMWIKQDDAPPHFSVDVRSHLNAVFPGRWIGRRGPMPWFARAPDLNPLYYFLWEYIKSLVFETPVETGIELVARIVAVCDILKNIPEICGRILYANVMLALRLVAVNLRKCCKMQNGTLIVSMYCICR